MIQYITDKFGNQIYITNERWEHIHKRHPETVGFETEIIKTIRIGSRKQIPLEPDVFRYFKSYANLPEMNSQIIVIIKLESNIEKNEQFVQNNFVITAYMK